MDPADPDASADGAGGGCRQSISMHDFLDFLKLSCQVQEQLIHSHPSESPLSQSDNRVDLNELAKNPLVNSLLPRAKQQPIKSPKQRSSDSSSSPLSGRDRRDTSTTAAKAKPKLRQSSRKSKESSSSALHPALEHKLNEVIDEGILDSVLQYMCPAAAPTAATAASGAKLTPDQQPTVPMVPSTPAAAAAAAPATPRVQSEARPNVVLSREPTKHPRRKSIPNQPSGE